jgi:hypothetical protein
LHLACFIRLHLLIDEFKKVHEKPSGQYLGLICDVIDMPRFEFESGAFSWFYTFILIRVENRDCLSHDV